MKNILYTLFAILILTPSFSQVAYIQYRHVPAENEDKFVELETEHWSKVAKAAIDNGHMLEWTLWKKVGVTEADAPNYAFINVYETVEQMASNDHWADNIKVAGIDPDEVSTTGISSVTFDYMVQIEDMIPGDFKYALVNYANPDDFEGFIMENKNIWKPIHQNNIKENHNGMTSWGIASVIYPQGNLDRFSCYTYDGFNTLADALNYMRFDSSWDEEGPLVDAISALRMDEIMIDGFEYRIIYERVMTVSAEE